MRSIKSMMMGGAILLGLSMCLTSCEGTLDDVFGEWSRPTGNASSGESTPSSGTDEGGGSSTINATAITLSQTMKVIKLGGDALTITADVTPSDATYTWESSDEAVATVANGVVTPKGVGIATITAKSGDLTATCEVFVGTVVDDVATRNPIQDYDILAGTKNTSAITIPAGCHVAFNEVNTNQGITCSGDATIYLVDDKTNSVSAPDGKAGIQIGGTGTTLTINAETAGTGKLTAQGGPGSAGIGTNASYSATGGNIVINGGTVTATGGVDGAGIGTGCDDNGNTCGDITINGGTVTATGSPQGAGIGTGVGTYSNTCGDITIGTGVTKVTATKGASSPNSIGKGAGGSTTNCGTITIGGVVYWENNNYVGTGSTYLTSDITYIPSN